MMANVDFFVEIEGGIYIIECKTSFSYHMDQWEDGRIPRHYELQGRHYMAVTNVQGVIFLCLHGNSEDTFIERRLDRDLDQEEELIEQEAYFWNHCVQMGKPPAYTESADLVLKSIRERLEIREKQQIELPEQLSENVAAFLKLKDQTCRKRYCPCIQPFQKHTVFPACRIRLQTHHDSMQGIILSNRLHCHKKCLSFCRFL